MLLDRFTLADVAGSRTRGRLLRNFHIELYYAAEAQRELHKTQILETIRKQSRAALNFQDWSRIVDLRFTSDPLSPQGSLFISGRFSIGYDVDTKRFPTFPALYLASDFPTAYCEKFQVPHGGKVNGLAPEELRACQGRSWSKVEIRGEVRRVLDVSNLKLAQMLCRIFAKFKVPATAMKAARQAGVRRVSLVTTPKQFYSTILADNWRALPSQFSLPSNSQILARLALEAGCEAILYPSAKYGKSSCLAILTRSLAHDQSFIEIADEAASIVQRKRIDSTSSTFW